jgi:hypothetical protein
MLFQPKVRNEIQDRLDQTRDLEDVVPDQATEGQEECPFQMTGLYEVIPGIDLAPLRLDSAAQSKQS